MCENCYHEEYGAPTEITDNAVLAAALIRKLYARFPTGGLCHMVIDDWNLDDSAVAYCKDSIAIDGSVLENEVITALAAMPVRERAVSLALADGFLRLQS